MPDIKPIPPGPPQLPPPANPPPQDAIALATPASGFQKWLRGLVSVAVSSGASGVALVVADPQSFNLHQGLPKLAEVCGGLSLVHVALYLQKSPIWDASVQVNAPAASTVNVTNQQ